MYVSEELIAHAEQHNVEVTGRQIREWTRNGLLPAPTRVALAGQGRTGVPYRYPETALKAVVWIGRYRRFIDGVETTQFWMRIEGFDHVDLDINEYLRVWAERAWEEARTRVPSLPELRQSSLGIPDVLQERLLDEIDDNISSCYLESGLLTDKVAAEVTIGGALLGIIPPRYLEDEPALTGAEDDGRYRPYSDYLLEEGEQHYAELARTVLPQMITVGNLMEIHRAATQGALNEDDMRTLWRRERERLSEGGASVFRRYNPLALAVMYLASERLVLPQIRAQLPHFVRMLQMVADDPETPPELAASLRGKFQATRELLGDDWVAQLSANPATARETPR
ncbi:MAG: hypothetical protein M3P51_16785 [Chloroflexota bacterium]|nr:hypothetical protein [Chloroflexota bacterium]